ncbi:MAG: S8 family serine peptidase, partial [Lentisphaeria bacterium]|nr:S8 family serine peptidase [Lentisphaeria bacterium]
MKSFHHFWPILVIGLLVMPNAGVLANSTVNQSNGSGAERRPIWVIFHDKGQAEEAYARGMITAPHVSQRAIERRLLRGTRDILNYMDVEIPEAYIQQVLESGVEIRVISRWFNAISVLANEQEENYINSLPMVKKTKRVMRVSRRFLKKVQRNPDQLNDANEIFEDYGNSYAQLEQINAIAAHNDGYSGDGVWVLMLDTGYLTSHSVFQAERVVAEYDFIQDDSITTNQAGDFSSQHDHGTATASVVGGYSPGNLLGVAFNCAFLLAKTEIVNEEAQIEEDYYVAGLEWGEALGADVVSSSLGYIDWYTFDQMDGETALTTQAVDIAASLGMVCVTAAGNERGSNWGHIISPADADSVISVGAVDSDGDLANFSSPGPTADGRIKPEVVARGVYTQAAGTGGDEHYITASGTSLSTPLIAGAAALILEAHPD